ncbi:tetratricopeptide repeat protein [Propionibacterium australiense]|uniref:Tetratricopeptide repeat protein n=1 Tax=Propionibacterium australiense TaxID=119981 RepID=A0A383SA07_9ACTN|nr:tetratricopeptide repeat protein [Propionibacterium australiense]RLP06764.1 tetratricopeptide repeat protein [Propionibacterium australiense]RLP06930.1 tetratricopeptide repeat protein [Propionibacterium australiense]SYZ34076.1 Tetratricopeptide-like helical domain [Propionibacterium australiense]VEH92130.1 Putative Zn-dependent protease, contains TPR repeats [Propionibacterium australiense]
MSLDFDERLLSAPVRAELRGLPLELAREVMAHLIAAGELIEEDPELANRHAQAARRRAARLPIVREAAAETAYAAGDYATALTEYRAVARMTGNDEYLPVIADCERAIGRHDNALRTIRQGHEARLDATQRAELVLVEAGLRHDMGQDEEALRVLRQAIENKTGRAGSQARLRYAYADLLAAGGDTGQAITWFTAAGRLDRAHELDVAERLEALGAEVPDDFRASIDETDEDLYVEEQEIEPAQNEGTAGGADDELGEGVVTTGADAPAGAAPEPADAIPGKSPGERIPDEGADAPAPGQDPAGSPADGPAADSLATDDEPAAADTGDEAARGDAVEASSSVGPGPEDSQNSRRAETEEDNK